MSQSLAFAYLDEVKKLFASELEKKFGKEYEEKLKTLGPSGELNAAGTF